MLKVWWLFLCIFFSHSNAQNSCGPNSIPFEFRVSLDGIPEIQCAIPECVKGANDDDENYAYGNRHHSISAECNGTFSEAPCSLPNEWTAGVEEAFNNTHYILKSECCKFNGLNNVSNSQTFVIRSGDHYTGGEVKDSEGKLSSGFDLIKEVRKSYDENQEAIYLVTISRMACTASKSLDSRLRFENDRLYDSEEVGISLEREYEEKYHPGYRRSSGRYRPSYRAQIRRRPRQFYRRPIFDEYDYYDFNSMPIPRGRNIRRFPRRYSPDAHYQSNGLSRSYLDPNLYTNSIQQEQPQFYSNNEIQQSSDQSSSSESQSLLSPFQQTPTSFTLFPTVTLPPPPPLLTPFNFFPTQSPASPCTTEQCKPKALSSNSGAASRAKALASPTGGYSNDQYYNYNDPNSQYYSQAQQGSYSPSSGGYDYSSSSSSDPNAAFSSLQCFSGDVMVQTPAGHKRMDELKVGDMVLSIEHSMISYAPVIMFLHNDPQEVATFKEIETSDNRKLKLTDFHLIYVSSCKLEPLRLVHAKDIKVGECLYSIEELEAQQTLKSSSKVIAIRDVEDIGIYAPLTSSGDIFVNSVLSSCHSNMGLQTLQQTFFVWYHKMNAAFASARSFFGIAQDEDFGSGDGLPFGVKYLTSIMDVVVPKSFLS